jgi:hypothetical protein
MPRLSWNEIETRAEAFADRWQGETYEKGNSQAFWSEFLTIFGVDHRRHGAFFEYAIKKAGDKQGFIDLFRPGYPSAYDANRVAILATPCRELVGRT